jgi:hypothetical protein
VVLPRFEFRMIWVIITAIAAAAIAFYVITNYNLPKKNYQLAVEINSANGLRAESEDEFRQYISDLYKAIVISNLARSPNDLPIALEHFHTIYKQAGGKTKIFEEIKS